MYVISLLYLCVWTVLGDSRADLATFFTNFALTSCHINVRIKAMYTSNDTTFMGLALQEAKKGMGYTSPNPLVGAVVVKNDQIIGRGYHKQHGTPHAEVNALADCADQGHDPTGATMYVTLEPCAHTGKTPPCTLAVIQAGIKRVVIASRDPNPQASGGAAVLQAMGIDVSVGVLEQEALALNEIFFHYITTGRPFVLQKYAMTLDGKIATHTRASKYITSGESLARVHLDRLKHSAIMVGVGTVIADDPSLTCRLPDDSPYIARNPIRIVCDTHLRTPLDSQVIRTARETPTLIATCNTDAGVAKPFLDAGAHLVHVPPIIVKETNTLDLCALMETLGKRGIDSILLEGGAALHWSALHSGIVNKINAYIAPKVFGGEQAKGPVGGLGVETPDSAFLFDNVRYIPLGQDLLVEAVPRVRN